MKLVLLRHGESQWNKENRFTGWTDIDLTEKGIEEAKSAGKLLKAEGFTFDVVYTSVLKRAIHTLWNVLDEMDLAWIPVYRSWRLNERSYDVRPPELDINDKRHPSNELKYNKIDKELLPATECLKDTVDRFLPYWHETIKPAILHKQKVLIVAHGNSLRALVKYLDNMSDEEILKINIPTGIPLLYDCLLYTSPSPRDRTRSRMPSSA